MLYSIPLFQSKINHVRFQARGNPAFTLTITKTDGADINIDVSPCLIRKVGEQTKQYIPKSHPIMKDNNQQRPRNYEHLWLRTATDKETRYLKPLCQREKDCLRVPKALLDPYLHNSYIVKTAWLNMVKGKQKSPKAWDRPDVVATALCDMIDYLEKAFDEGCLPSRFNPEENVMARYGEQYLKSSHGFLKSLNDKRKANDWDGLMKNLRLTD